MPLANINELAPGKAFPPERVRAQHERFERYWRWSQGSVNGIAAHYATYSGVTGSVNLPTAERRFAALEGDDQPRLQENAFTFMQDFWRDATLEEAPTITGADNEQPTIDSLAPSLISAAGVVVEDIVRYGVGCFVNRTPGMVQSLDPRWWFPIRPLWDVAAPGMDVAAWPWASGNPTEIDRLLIEEYGAQTTRRFHRLDGLTIGPRHRRTPDDPRSGRVLRRSRSRGKRRVLRPQRLRQRRAVRGRNTSARIGGVNRSRPPRKPAPAGAGIRRDRQ